MPRIIAGTHRSRSLEAPPGLATRPYTDRVKESVFNILRGHIEGANVLDLFAGIGTMGFEAVSRGAANVVMIEKDRRVHAVLERNLEKLDCSDQVEVVLGDALSTMPVLRAPRPVHIIFIDPPYEMMKDQKQRERILDQVGRLAELLDDDGYIILRSPLQDSATDHSVPGLNGPEVRAYKKQHNVLLYAKGGGES